MTVLMHVGSILVFDRSMYRPLHSMYTDVNNYNLVIVSYYAKLRVRCRSAMSHCRCKQTNEIVRYKCFPDNDNSFPRRQWKWKEIVLVCKYILMKKNSFSLVKIA